MAGMRFAKRKDTNAPAKPSMEDVPRRHITNSCQADAALSSAEEPANRTPATKFAETSWKTKPSNHKLFSIISPQLTTAEPTR